MTGRICPAFGKFFPQLIDLFLSLTVHKKGDRFRELELRTGIQAHEFLTFQFESHGHHFSVRSTDAQDLSILENRDVEVHRLFSLTIKPQERSNCWHVLFLLTSGSAASGVTSRSEEHTSELQSPC